MTEQNLENMLNLALDATEKEREKSLNLDVGYYPIEKEWELIVKYSGSLDAVREFAVQVTELKNEYAIVVVRESDIQRLADLPQVEYIEKPKRLYFQVENGRRVSCINLVQDTRFFIPGRPEGTEGLFGKGVLVAILDSGIDYANMDFRNPDGTTRIVSIWDQTTPGTPPAGYALGAEYSRQQIDDALLKNDPLEMRRLVPVTDTSGHGTAVAGIAAGNGLGSGNRYRGVASESELIVVKLGRPREEGFPRTTELMMGLNYVVEKALETGKPVAVNISIGNTYGSHEPYN